MTALQLLNGALALLGTTSTLSPDYSQYALPLINLLIAETFDVNNTIRLYKQKEELAEIPSISTLEDTMPTEEELNRSAFIYGLCSKLLLNDDDMARVSYFQNMCASEIDAAVKGVPRGVIDVYGGTSE